MKASTTQDMTIEALIGDNHDLHDKFIYTYITSAIIEENEIDEALTNVTLNNHRDERIKFDNDKALKNYNDLISFDQSVKGLHQIALSSLKKSFNEEMNMEAVDDFRTAADDEDVQELIAIVRNKETSIKAAEIERCYKRVNERIQEIIDKTKKKKSKMRRIHRLASYILQQHFPESWKDILYDAYNLLVELLDNIYEHCQEVPEIFPRCWTKHIFRLENVLTPDEVKGVIFGIDPPNTALYCVKTNNKSMKVECTYTGHAFCLNVPNGYTINHTPLWMKGLQDVYCLSNEISLTNSELFEENFVRKYGLALVNFIRMIPRGYLAGSQNWFFKHAWAKFHYAWLRVGLGIRANGNAKNKVLIFENPNYSFNGYCSDEVSYLLTGVPRCVHPTHIKEDKVESVKCFHQYMTECKASDAVDTTTTSTTSTPITTTTTIPTPPTPTTTNTNRSK